MEAPDLAGGGACTFRENEQRVALVDDPLDSCLATFVIKRGRETIQVPRHNAEERIVPYIILDYHHNLRRKRQAKDDIDERLMVGYDNRLAVGE